jgi:hypothetical protein
MFSNTGCGCPAMVRKIKASPTFNFKICSGNTLGSTHVTTDDVSVFVCVVFNSQNFERAGVADLCKFSVVECPWPQSPQL